MVKTCIVCQEKFEILYKSWQSKKYCSQVCYWKTLKGKHISPETEIKAGSKGLNNRGGYRSKNGYLWIWKPKHRRAGKSGYVLNSVLVAEKTIRRKLCDDELVHHINYVKSDDRPENLQVIKKSDHMKIHKPRLGMENSPEHRKKISLSHRRYQSPETRRKISETMKRKGLSPQLYK